MELIDNFRDVLSNEMLCFLLLFTHVTAYLVIAMYCSIAYFNLSCLYTGLRSQKLNKKTLFVLYSVLIIGSTTSLFWTGQNVLKNNLV